MLPTRPVPRRTLLVLAASAGIATWVHPSVLARQDATPDASSDADDGMPPLPEGAVPVAQGLWNPGDLVFGDDGSLYIAQSGISSGDTMGEVQATPLPNGTPVTTASPLVPPQIAVVAPDGAQSTLTTAIGGVGIAIHDGELFVAEGGGSVGTGFAPLAEENTISAINLETGAIRLVAALGPYEVEHNPDGADINPNLYGMAISDDGTIYQTDAGGNTIYKVDAKTGDFSLFAVVPNLTDLTGATPTADDQDGPRQPVPTSVVVDAGGNVVVTLLGEMWPGPSILSFTPDGNSYTVGISGLSMIVDSTLGPDGLLYVSQLTADFTTDVPAPGAVFRINADGTVEPVVEGLFLPHGITFDTDGNLYVATNSIISSPDAPLGMVVRIDGVAVPH
ncbi:MAG: ScyD/ScyE family protein [Thermomicrobiales bacterium]